MRKSIVGGILAGVCLLAPAYGQITVTVSPSPASVHLGTFQQFTARVTGTTPTTVTWTIAPATGAGTITANGGRYTPPAVMPNPNTVTVTATSNASPTNSASVVVTLLNPYPALASVQPANIPVGSFTIALNGSGFAAGAVSDCRVAPGKKPGCSTCSAELASAVIAFMAGVTGDFTDRITRWSVANNPFFDGSRSDLLSVIPFAVLSLLLYLVSREVILAPRSGKKV